MFRLAPHSAPCRTPTLRNAPRGARATLPAALLVAAALAACGGDTAGDAAADDARPQAGGEASASTSPPGTDVWLGELAVEGDAVSVTDLRNATHRAGYDNQPAFTPAGDAVLYTRDDDDGRTDIWRLDVAAGTTAALTETLPESEYSATPIPGADGFSAVRVEADSTQRLWRFPWSGRNPAVLFPDVAPVGYHGWASESWVAMFVLGDPPTLVVAGGETGASREVARDIGRSIQRIPGEEAVSFVQRLPFPEESAPAAAPDTPSESAGEGSGDAAGERVAPTRIMRWSPAGGVSAVTDAPAGVDDHAWTPDGVILAGRGSEILAWREGWDEWRVVGSVPTGGTVSRLAVSPDGGRIAVVVEAPTTD